MLAEDAIETNDGLIANWQQGTRRTTGSLGRYGTQKKTLEKDKDPLLYQKCGAGHVWEEKTGHKGQPIY